MTIAKCALDLSGGWIVSSIRIQEASLDMTTFTNRLLGAAIGAAVAFGAHAAIPAHRDGDLILGALRCDEVARLEVVIALGHLVEGEFVRARRDLLDGREESRGVEES